jgi:tRNA (guanine-N7-)-methyltransferase
VGKNKLKKFEEMATYPHVIQTPFNEVLHQNHALWGKWNEEFFGNDHPIVLELGCGKGEYTVGLARMFPRKNFIGVDIKGNRMHRGATESLNEGLENVGFLRTRIEVIHAFFAPSEVDEIWLTFPDPQIKKYRKRLTSTRFLETYARFLKPGGLIHLKTDSLFMYTYTRELLKVNDVSPLVDEVDLYSSGYQNETDMNFEVPNLQKCMTKIHREVHSTDNLNIFCTKEILRIQTYYESKWLEHGIPIKYLMFELQNASNLREPDVEIEPDSYRSAGRGVKPRCTK